MTYNKDFEAGAIWALELLEAQVDARVDKTRRMAWQAGDNGDVDVAGILNSTSNIMISVKLNFQTGLSRGLRQKSAEVKEQ